MKSFNLKIVIIILLFIFTLGFSSKYLFHSENTMSQINKNKIEEKKDIQLLEKMHYKGANTDSSYFYDNVYNIISNNINLYKSSWLVEIYSYLNLNLSKEYTDQIKKGLENYSLSETKSFDPIYNVYLKIKTEKNLNKSFSNETINEYKKLLFIYFSKKEGMFFLKNPNDNLEDKISSTILALECLDILGVKTSEIPKLKKTKNTIKKLFMNDNYFNTSTKQQKYNLINVGLPLFKVMELLDISIEELDKNVVKKRIKWFNFWIENFNQKPSKDFIINNQIILNMKTASDFLNTNLSINKKYRNDLALLDNQNFDMQVVLNMIQVNRIINPDENVNNFKDLIRKNTPNSIFEGQIKFNLKDNYFGMLTAQHYSYKFNRNNAIRSILKYLENNKLNNFEDLYLLAQSFNLLGNIEHIKPYISEVYTNILKEKDKNHKLENLKDKYYQVKIVDILNEESQNSNLKFFNLNSKEIIDAIKNNKSEEELYYLANIAYYNNVKIDKDEMDKQVSKYLKCNNNYCGYSINGKNDGINLISTYRMIELKESYNIFISDSETEGLNKYLKMLKGSEGGFFLIKPKDKNSFENYSNKFLLEGFYYGAYLEKKLNIN